ncbi:MAG: hydrogenase nickel incorporation protein HypB [Chloroflexota bacterium]|jgi:hydrogenase nickel incorporation protein HypB
MKVPVITSILSDNDAIAAENRVLLDHAGVLGLNLMASPGAGKTSLVLATCARLPASIRPAVIEGDLASRIDADTIAARGIPVVQINTGGGCHLDAPMIRSALPHLPLADANLLLVENVGNLVCTAGFALGTHLNVVVASAPEGHDKPFKYPHMFAAANAVLLNKADLLAVFEFDIEAFARGVRQVNDRAPIIPLSCKSGAGMDEWLSWLLPKVRAVSREP